MQAMVAKATPQKPQMCFWVGLFGGQNTGNCKLGDIKYITESDFVGNPHGFA